MGAWQISQVGCGNQTYDFHAPLFTFSPDIAALPKAIDEVKNILYLFLTDPDAAIHTLLAFAEHLWQAHLVAAAEKRRHHFYTESWSETIAPLHLWPILQDVPPTPSPNDTNKTAPQVLRPFIPPTFDSPDGILYWGGFTWSMVEWLDNQIPWNSLIPHLEVHAKSEPPQEKREKKLGLFDLLRHLKFEDFKVLLKAGLAYLKTTPPVKIDKYHAGRLVGIVFCHLIDVILLVLAAYDLVLKAGQIANLIQEAGGIVKLVSALSEGGAAKVSQLLRDAYKRLHPPPVGISPPENYAADYRIHKEVERGETQLHAQAKTDATEKAIRPGEGTLFIHETFPGEVKYGTARLKKLQSVVNAEHGASGFEIKIRGEDPDFDKVLERQIINDGGDPDLIDGTYYASLQNGEPGFIWIKPDPSRVTVFEELTHYFQDARTHFTEGFGQNKYKNETEAQMQLLYIGAPREQRRMYEFFAKDVEKVKALLKKAGYENDLREIDEKGWEPQELRNIHAYFHENSQKVNTDKQQ